MYSINVNIHSLNLKILKNKSPTQAYIVKQPNQLINEIKQPCKKKHFMKCGILSQDDDLCTPVCILRVVY